MRICLTFVACLLICTGLVSGQEASTEKSDKENTGSRDVSHIEKEIAACKLVECRNEVELAKFAQQKSQNAQVKEFAAKMIKDHSEACKDLEKWAGDYRTTAIKRTDVDTKPEGDGEKPATRLELQTKKGGTVGVDFNAGKSANSGSFNWVAIHQEMANKCLEVSKKELSEKEGAEFDKCYIGMQLGAHQKMIIADEVLAKYVSSEAREKLEKCKSTATEHLQAAKSIMKSLEGGGSAQVSRKP